MCHFAVLPSLSRKAIRLKITFRGHRRPFGGGGGVEVPLQAVPVALLKMNQRSAHITSALWFHKMRTITGVFCKG